MNIAIYARKSKITENGESIKTQIEICKEYISNNYENAKYIIYEDEGFSGKNTDRPSFNKMISDIKKNKIQIIICYKLDRISRNISDFSKTLDILNNHNISFVSVKEHFDTTVPMGRAMMYISSVFAQLERETTAERIKDNIRKLAKTGRWLGGTTPTGFTYIKDEYKDNNLNKKTMCRLIPNEEELKIVNTIFKKYIELGSLNKVLNYTIQNNIKTRNNSNFSISSIKNILINPVYVKSDKQIYNYYLNLGCNIVNQSSEFNGNGILLTNRFDQTNKNKIKQKNMSEWVIAVSYHKGIINSDIWLKVQNIININKHKFPRTDSSTTALFSSLILCPQCGSKMYVIHRSNKNQKFKHYYYKCYLKQKSKNTACIYPNLNGNYTDEIILSKINHFSNLNNKNLILKLKSSKHIINENNIYTFETDLNIEKKINLLEKKIQNLTIQLSENNNSSVSQYIIKQIESFHSEIYSLKNEIIKKNNEKNNFLYNSDYKNALENLKKYYIYINKMNFNTQKKYLKEIIDKIEINNNKFKITFKL